MKAREPSPDESGRGSMSACATVAGTCCRRFFLKHGAEMVALAAHSLYMAQTEAHVYASPSPQRVAVNLSVSHRHHVVLPRYPPLARQRSRPSTWPSAFFLRRAGPVHVRNLQHGSSEQQDPSHLHVLLLFTANGILSRWSCLHRAGSDQTAPISRTRSSAWAHLVCGSLALLP